MVEGSCLCGAVRIKSIGETVNKGLCHCLDCRKITGSTHSTNLIVPSDGFSVTKGTPKKFDKIANSGKTVSLFFCGDCGSTLWSQSSTYGNTRVIKAGTLDNDGALEDARPLAEIFAKNRPAWLHAIPGAEQYESS